MPSPSMRILIWSPAGAGHHYHGPATSTYRLFKAMKSRHDVCLTLVHGSTRQSAIVDIFDEIIGLPATDPSRYRKNLRFVLSGLRWLRHHAHEFSVMYTPAPNALTLFPARFAGRRGLPAVSRVSAARTELQDNGVFRTMLQFSRRRVAQLAKLSSVIAVSSEIESRLHALGMPAEKIVRIPNSADCERFRPATAEEKFFARRRFSIPDAASLVILCVGAVANRKGQHLLVNTLPSLPERVHLLLVGPCVPDYRDAIVRMAYDAGVSARLHWSDHVHDVEQAYRASDIFALPSNGEGMPNALVEAMASGLACIGTPVSGISDLLEGNTRGTVVARSQAEIVAAINVYCENEDLRRAHGASARTYIVTNQSSDMAADRVYNLLCAVAASGGRGQTCQ